MHTESFRAPHGAADPLLPQACAWIGALRESGETVLPYPISRLQRQFRIGYGRTCALVHALAQRGEWRIVFDEDGTRFAHLNPELPA